MIGFGADESVAFENALSGEEAETESPILEGLGISIPYLTTKNEEQKRVTVQMKLFTGEEGHHIDANIGLSAPIVADVFSKTINGTNVDIQLEKGDLELHLVGGPPEPCASNGQHEIAEVQEYERELQISLSGPDFSICDRLPDLQVDLCDVYRDPQYNQVLKQAKNNVCQYWEPTDDVQNTKITYRVESMSQPMRKYLLLDENQVLEGELQSGTFDIKMVFPCFE
ncbi:hypothetical protein HOLleu_00246 [Holothuria leucospilota]|uniref:Uncharacterized protein n=1 Tax=Holothuria leucospilota TaxID=206669 RepID=A0A9Q1HJJ2_HOLLE|nr:hypothetical protein HOLleu_00246 [Holothuria leucospilota]